MLMVRERIDKWTEDNGMLGEIQCGFRRGGAESQLPPLLFNIYVRELGKVLSKCVHGVIYAGGKGWYPGMEESNRTSICR